MYVLSLKADLIDNLRGVLLSRYYGISGKKTQYKAILYLSKMKKAGQMFRQAEIFILVRKSSRNSGSIFELTVLF